jgi:hypothetical protein
MKSSIKQILSISIASILVGCTGAEMKLPDDFGAYYTKVITGEEWETYDRTGDYADIIVDYGKQRLCRYHRGLWKTKWEIRFLARIKLLAILGACQWG